MWEEDEEEYEVWLTVLVSNENAKKTIRVTVLAVSTASDFKQTKAVGGTTKADYQGRDITALVIGLGSAVVIILISEAFVAEVLVEPKGCSVPQANDGGLAYSVSSLEHHLHNLLESPGAGYVGESTYLLPVACIVGFRFVDLSAAK